MASTDLLAKPLYGGLLAYAAWQTIWEVWETHSQGRTCFADISRTRV